MFIQFSFCRALSEFLQRSKLMTRYWAYLCLDATRVFWLSSQSAFLVLKMGLEPIRSFEHLILSQARLPIPPLKHRLQVSIPPAKPTSFHIEIVKVSVSPSVTLVNRVLHFRRHHWTLRKIVKCLTIILIYGLLVPGNRLELSRLFRPGDFKSPVSADSTTLA